MHMEYFVFGFILTLVGMISGAVLAWSCLKEKYEKIAQEEIEKEQLRALHAIREGYRKNEARTKLLLEELGEALDVDVAELPSFGYVLLKGAGEVTEGFLEARGDGFEESRVEGFLEARGDGFEESRVEGFLEARGDGFEESRGGKLRGTMLKTRN